jgi:hypothetical protein
VVLRSFVSSVPLEDYAYGVRLPEWGEAACDYELGRHAVVPGAGWVQLILVVAIPVVVVEAVHGYLARPIAVLGHCLFAAPNDAVYLPVRY